MRLDLWVVFQLKILTILFAFSCPDGVCGQLKRWPFHSLTDSVTDPLLILNIKEQPRDLSPLRVMRKHYQKLIEVSVLLNGCHHQLVLCRFSQTSKACHSNSVREMLKHIEQNFYAISIHTHQWGHHTHYMHHTHTNWETVTYIWARRRCGSLYVNIKTAFSWNPEYIHVYTNPPVNWCPLKLFEQFEQLFWWISEEKKNIYDQIYYPMNIQHDCFNSPAVTAIVSISNARPDLISGDFSSFAKQIPV